MPATTPRLALPYPIPDDTVDVPRDVEALADKLDGLPSLAPALVTALPGSPVDGQEVYLQNSFMAGAGVLWHLRYRAASASAYKWECLGGSPLYHEAPDNASTATTAYTTLVPGPTINLGLAGEYMIAYGCRSWNSTSAPWTNFAAPKLGAAATSDGDSCSMGANIANIGQDAASREVMRAIAAASTVTLQYRVSAGNGTFTARWMRIMPVRLG